MLLQLLLLPLLLLLQVYAAPKLEKVTTDGQDNYPPLPSDTGSLNILPLDLRSLNDWKLTDLLLVSDIDGNLHAVQRNTGTFLWSLPIDEPLVRILKQVLPGKEAGKESNLLWFVEPYQDGSLYYFSPLYGLNKLPTSIKNLVMESPFSLSGDNKIYTGSRKTSLYTINLNTGEVVNQFGTPTEKENCPLPNVYFNLNKADNSEFIMIGKTTYQLSIHSKVDANVVWNVTYSQWGPNNIDNDLIMQNVQSMDDQYFTPFHDKSLLAINKVNGTPAWISKLPSLAVNVFDVFNSRSDSGEFVVLPHPLKVLNDLQLNERDYGSNDLCFINKTASGEEWFAMSFQNYPTLLKSAPVSQYQMALYKYENGVLDQDNVKFLKEFNVIDAEVEQFVSGVHRIYHLNPENMYQPVAKFGAAALKRIGDGSDHNENSKLQTDKESKQIPSLMDGILFPNTRDHQRLDLSTLDGNNKDIIPNKGSYYTDLPVNYHRDEKVERGNSRQSLSMLRRVAEDLFVMSALLLFLLAFSKFSHLVKYWKARESGLSAATQTKELPPSPVVHLTKSLPDIPVSTSQIDSQQVSEETLNEENDTKKVTFADEDNIEEGFEKIFDKDEDTIVTENFGEGGDADSEAVVTKKRRKRGSRGGKRGGRGKKNNTNKEDVSGKDLSDDGKDDRKTDDEDGESEDEPIQTTSLVKTFTKPAIQMKKLQIDNNLVLSDKILGYGSHGTVVYEGTFENRPVAVKRMLLDFYDIANHEVRLLQESDDHPNVIRYFCSQSSEQEKFLYIALELCVCSLEDIIEKLLTYPKELWINHSSYCDVLYQLVGGLHYLHSLKIVHRDLKPQNILVGETNKRSTRKDANCSVRLLISDFGLCKKLDADQSSFRATTQHAASGTSGWRAPELLLHHDLLEISPDTVSSNGSTSRHSFKDGTTSNNGQGKRLTKAIDIFSLGCVFYYILSGGSHPFGDRYLREGNIIRGAFDLSLLKSFCPRDHVEADDLISLMISFNPKLRPDTATLLRHPYFWDMNKKLEFLLKVSDRFEIERRDPPSEMLLTLEKISYNVHGGDWLSKFDQLFTDNLGKYRKYSTEKVMDLLRALRNKYHHYNDMPSELQVQMSPLPHGFYKYFNDKFPRLLMEVYYVVKENLQEEHVFQPFF